MAVLLCLAKLRLRVPRGNAYLPDYAAVFEMTGGCRFPVSMSKVVVVLWEVWIRTAMALS